MHTLYDVSAVVEHAPYVLSVHGASEMWIAVMLGITDRTNLLQCNAHRYSLVTARHSTCVHTYFEVASTADTVQPSGKMYGFTCNNFTLYITVVLELKSVRNSRGVPNNLKFSSYTPTFRDLTTRSQAVIIA